MNSLTLFFMLNDGWRVPTSLYEVECALSNECALCQPPPCIANPAAPAWCGASRRQGADRHEGKGLGLIKEHKCSWVHYFYFLMQYFMVYVVSGNCAKVKKMYQATDLRLSFFPLMYFCGGRISPENMKSYALKLKAQTDLGGQ